MGAAYYIVLDLEIAGLDPFVNGKAIARESERLALVTQQLGLRDVNEFVSADPDELLAIAEELGVELTYPPQYARVAKRVWPGAGLARPR